MSEDCGACRRAHLAGVCVGIDGDVAQKFCGGWRGDRQDAMCAFDETGADTDRSCVDFFGRYPGDQHACSEYVCNGIELSNFMEVDLFDRAAVRFGFRLSEAVKNGHHMLAHGS